MSFADHSAESDTLANTVALMLTTLAPYGAPRRCQSMAV